MYQTLKALDFFTEAELQEAMEAATFHIIPKGQIHINQGEVCKDVLFIKKGLMRSFYYNSESEEVTYCFSFENAFFTAYSSWIQQKPSPENIQAITDTEVYIIKRHDVLRLQENSINWQKFFRTQAEGAYISLENRIMILQRESAEKRYEDLLEKHPEYLQQIPLNYLASYLGITQRHLSRIRQNLANLKPTVI